METTKHLKFDIISKKPKTNVYQVLTLDNYALGIIKWHPAWRQYCFFTEGYDTLWSKDCLEDLATFIKQLMEARKHNK